MELNGCATLYSIARSFLMSTTSQVFSNGAVILPMINFFDFKNEENKNDI